MIIVIDGYNLLYHLFPGSKGKLEKQRDELIRSLSFYKSKKGLEIIVVFDGGELARATREVKKGVVVVFAGQKMSADEWIIEYIERNKEKSFLLVSRDRKLIEQCSKYNVDPVDVGYFYTLLQEAVLNDVEYQLTGAHQGSITKYEHDDQEEGMLDSEALDILMRTADAASYAKDEESEKSRTRSAHKLSKSQKRLHKKINKL